MPAQPTPQRLRHDGAELHYEVRGSGPVLLVVGQPMTSEGFATLADLLAVDRTVVTYDPRGMGRSTVDDPGLDVTPEAEADDLAAIVEAVGAGPVDVFGSSGGAVAGLALVARHPEQVRTLVAHEPPLCELLPDAAEARTAVDAVEAAYLAGGSGAGWGKFVSLVMHQGPIGPDGVAPASWPPHGADADGEAGGPSEQRTDDAPPPAEPSAKQIADDELFFRRMLPPFTRWEAPVDALRDHGGVVVAVGQASREELASRATRALADRLGTAPVPFPGDHGGFMADPSGFAEALRGVLRAR